MEKLTIVKVGGAVVEDEARLCSLLDNFCLVRGAKILVHGGGRSATRIASELGIESRMEGGRRITDAAMLRVVTMVYGGLVNKNVVARLQARGVNAAGLTGADMDIIRSVRRPVRDGIDFGFVGDVERVDARRITALIGSGITPVLAPLTHDGCGSMLNTNADTIAAETAKAMASVYDVTLVYCFEKPGVLADPDDENSVIPVITRQTFDSLKADGTVSGGMVPKLENALSAVDMGVGRVLITDASCLGHDDKGTVIRK